MDIRSFFNSKAFLSEFISCIRKNANQPFRMSISIGQDTSIHFLFSQIPIGAEGCSYVFGRYSASEDIYSCLTQALQVFAISTPDAVYLSSELVNIGPSCWSQDEWQNFNDEIGIHCFYFPNFCQDYRKHFMATEMMPFYDSLVDLPELDDEQKYECLCDARKYLVFQTKSDTLADYAPVFGISNSVIAQMLCGITAPFEEYRKLHLIGEQDRMKLHKAHHTYTLALIQANADFEPWELEMIHALQGLNPRSHLDVTFQCGERKGLAIMTPMSILTAFTTKGCFHSHSFYSHYEGRKLIMKLTHSSRYLLPRDIVRIEAKSKVLFSSRKSSD